MVNVDPNVVNVDQNMPVNVDQNMVNVDQNIIKLK